ncbi:MAG: histidine phosphatase family protein [Candidatus Cohnella colombiensis]|uniref:Histidine phosphatase family protein n=1 Tax=Candidatus Cohnella colombiensis TaxID=3121368 RepID=A0AA95EZU7_9BACL|nr:MAG: histidine phosphatase family protein [Cohnella sp.]
MTLPLRIGWIRHGVTEWNRLGKIQGVTNIPLSQEGVIQARLLANRLAVEDIQWDRIVSSDLLRAVHTAEIVAERLDIPLNHDSRLRERSFGDAEGTTEQERLMKWGTEWRELVPNQESDDAVIARGLAFIDELKTCDEGQSWLVVTHGGFLVRLLKALCGELPEGFLRNVSYTIVEMHDQKWNLKLYNCTEHLVEIKSGQ